MQKLTLSLVLALGASLTACDKPKTEAAKPAASASQASATSAFVGTDKGVLPCASCAGIETTLELAADGHYTLTTLFLEEPDAKPETVTGRYRQSDDKTLIHLDDDGGGYTYFIGDKQLEMRDPDGSTGGRSAEENANYRLQKQ